MANKPWIKDERKQKAIEHTERMAEKWQLETQESVNASRVYRGESPHTSNAPIIIVDDITTDGAVSRYGTGLNNSRNLAVINFASYKFPGGGFIIGAIAQEEAVCHASNLYNIIGDKRFEDEYVKNRSDLNKSLYSNFGIFTPNVIFDPYPDTDHDNYVTKAHVITVPAPNISAYKEHMGNAYDPEVAFVTMAERIKFVLDMAKREKCRELILGAFGCGVFGNDPKVVASLFKDMLTREQYEGCFDKVIFAIPKSDKNNNYNEFLKVFES